MDRAFTVPGAPEAVWPWLVQLGKRRAGWYLPHPVERFVPAGRRATRAIDPRWQHLSVGDLIPDYGGPDETFEVVSVCPPTARRPGNLVYRSRRGHTELSWAILLTREGFPDGYPGTRVHLRLRLGPVRHTRLAGTLGGAFDLLTVAGMAAGLRERLEEQAIRA